MTCTRTEQVLALLHDYALNPIGVLDGLTTREFAWAWRARHHTEVPVKALYRLSESGQVRDAMRRPCVVSGKSAVAWVPRHLCN